MKETEEKKRSETSLSAKENAVKNEKKRRKNYDSLQAKDQENELNCRKRRKNGKNNDFIQKIVVFSSLCSTR